MRRFAAAAGALGVLALASGCDAPVHHAPAPDAAAVDWAHYGGDAGGLRHSPLADVTPENVASLEQAWVHHSGDVSDGSGEIPSTTALEVTPIVVGGRLYYCTPFNRVFALDPETGEEIWVFDPEVDLAPYYANQLVCRGVTHWRDPDALPDAECAERILMATADARLFAIDAADGRPCADFGGAAAEEGADDRSGPGVVDLRPGVGELAWPGEYQQTSPPVVAEGVVVVGSAVSDNGRVDAPSGVVRGFDARTGRERWAWNALPPGFEPRPMDAGARHALGTANVWAPMSVDVARGLVFLPTGNTSPDYYGGVRNGVDYYASSVVALHAATGAVAWHYQTVHHDVWDYDVPAQPTLAHVVRAGETVPVVVQGTKMGHVFVLHRETGEPVFPVEERPVPGGSVAGETLSPTQPFPVRPAPIGTRMLEPDDAWGLSPWDRGWCRRKIEQHRFEGIFTPPSLEGTIALPGNAGGTNWGGLAVDPDRQRMIVTSTNLAFLVTLFPGEDYEGVRAANPDVEIAAQRGTPYALRRETFLSPLGLPCTPPPWGQLTAIDLATGDVVWEVSPGTTRDISPVPIPLALGTPLLGGPLLTASGLVFLGATMDDYLRAFDVETGRELWKGRLPAGGQATPMTYRARQGGAQYVVIAAGGHARAGTRLGDALVAFRLP